MTFNYCLYDVYDCIVFFFLVHIENTVKESEIHFLLDLDYNAYKLFLSEAYILALHIYQFLLKISTEP